MPPTLPRFLLLGGPLPDPATERLAGVVDLVTDAHAHADGAFVPADPEAVPALERFRETGPRLTVFAVTAGSVDVAERIRWIRRGADDLLDARTVGETLLRKIRSDAWRHATTAAQDAARAGDRVDRWLRAASRYMAAREGLVGDLGVQGRSRFLDAAFLRDQVLRAGDTDGSPDPFGQRRGGDRETLDWPVRLLAPFVAEGHLLNIGADGVCLALPTAPGPGERLQLAVAGDRVAGRVELEVRWQRRMGRGKWQVGAFGIACTLDDGA